MYTAGVYDCTVFYNLISMHRAQRPENLDKVRVLTSPLTVCCVFHVLITTRKSLQHGAMALPPTHFTVTKLVS